MYPLSAEPEFGTILDDVRVKDCTNVLCRKLESELDNKTRTDKTESILESET